MFFWGWRKCPNWGRRACVTLAGVLLYTLSMAPGFSQTNAEGAEAPVSAESATPATATDVPADYSLSAVLKALREANTESLQRLEQREARYADRLEQSQQRLAQAQAKLAAREAEGRRLEKRFDNNKVELNDKTLLLKDKIGALKELFGVFQQNASDLIGAFNGSATSLQFPDRDIWLEGFANRMKNASEVTSADDIKTLWFELMREINARSEIVRIQAPVLDEAGNRLDREIIRVGGFSLISGDAPAEYLQWKAGKQEVARMPRQPSGPYLAEIVAYANAQEGLHQLSVDPTGGTLLSLLAEKPTTEERVDQGGLVGYMILGLGALAFVLAVLKLLDILLISLRVRMQQRRLDQPQPGNPLGAVLATYQKYQHIDSEALEMRLHDCVSKQIGRVNRFTVFLAIISAVAPLMGLLGTVVGMINTFQAITLYGTGDPQTMAGGISQALITTVLGLVVAVPAVLLHAVVSAQAKKVSNLLKQQSALLLGDRLQEQAEESPHSAAQPLSTQPA